MHKTKAAIEMRVTTVVLGNNMKDITEKQSHQMDEMISTVKEINEVSQQIRSVIKISEVFAAQTNILRYK